MKHQNQEQIQYSIKKWNWKKATKFSQTNPIKQKTPQNTRPEIKLWVKWNLKNKIIIIQWNCRGIKPNYGEIKCINYNPNIICLWKTLLKKLTTSPSKDTTLITKQTLAWGNRPIVDTPIIVKNQIPHAVLLLLLQTNFQAIAIKVSLHRTITICSICIPPKHKLNKSKIENLIGQLLYPLWY